MEQILTKWEDNLRGGGVAVSSGFVVAAANLYITFCNWNLLFSSEFRCDMTKMHGDVTRMHLLCC